MPSYRFATALAACSFALALCQASVAHAGAGENPIIVTTMADGLDNADGACSLREAIRNANTNTAFSLLVGECPAGSATLTDVIVLAAGQSYSLTVAGGGDNAGDLDLYPQPAVPIGSAHLRIRSSVQGTLATILQLSPGERVIENHESSVVLSDLRLRGGATLDAGGAILNREGELLVERGEILENSALDGGGIYNTGLATLVLGSVLSNSAGSGRGGGILNELGGVLVVDGTDIVNNNARNGGGIANVGATLDLKPGTRVRFNRAEGEGGDGNGGGVYNVDDGQIQVAHVNFEFNSAHQMVASSGGRGGAIYNAGAPTLIISGGEFTGNQARGNGGAIFAEGNVSPSAAITQSVFLENRSQGQGGAIHGGTLLECRRCRFERNEALSGGAVRAIQTFMEESNLLDNTATADGGAISGQTLVYRDGSMIGNSVTGNAGSGGGAVFTTGLGVLERCIIRDNTSAGRGGAISLGSDPNQLTRILGCQLSGNIAQTRGGALFTGRGTLIANSTLSGNQAQEAGGVFIDSTGSVQMIHVTLANNLGDNLHKFGNLTTRNSLFSNPGGTNCIMGLDNPTLTSLGNNLSSDMSCFGLNPSLEIADIEGVDALLAPLAANGSPRETHALLPGSPAIDAASDSGCSSTFVGSIDQRRAPRPFGAACDIGAHEQGAEPPPRIFADGFENS